MNIVESFAAYLESSLDDVVIGDNLFIGGVPQEAPDSCWWVTASGGSAETKLETGEMVRNYQIDVFYRDIDEQAVYDSIQSLEETIDGDPCTQLSGYDTIDMEATLFSVDQDIDSEDRKVGLLQISIRTYKE